MLDTVWLTLTCLQNAHVLLLVMIQMQEFSNHFEGEKQKCVTYLIDSHIQLPELVNERHSK